MKEIERWARAVGLDTSAKKGQWEISVLLFTSGELPDGYVSEKQPWFWLKLVPNGWWSVLGLPLGRGKGVLKTSYVSWHPRAERWHQYVQGGDKRVKASQKLLPPRSLRTLREWLTGAETRLGVTFRRDRPGIQSNVKGGAKAMAAWIGVS